MVAPQIPGEEDPDIVVVILRQVVQMAPQFSEALARQIERDVKAEYGGRRVRIPKDKKHATEQARTQVFHDIVGTTLSDREIQHKHGISRATLYRWAKLGPTEPKP